MLNREVIERVPEKFRRVLLREIEPLVTTKHVLAVGVVGSLARGDYWDGADIDINIIVRGDRPYVVLLKFREVEIDFAYFTESQHEWLPYDLVPIYDPYSIIRDILKKRDKNATKSKMIDDSIERSKRYLVKSRTFLNNGKLFSCLSSIHQAAEGIAEAFTLLRGEAPTTRRTISRLEKAMSKKEDKSLFEKYLSLYNITENLMRVDFFYHTLKSSYNRIWESLVAKGIGSITISPETTFSNFFRSRFESVYHHDMRDFVWLTFHEFPFILQYSMKLQNLDDLPEKLEGRSLLWVKSYKAILETIPLAQTSAVCTTAQQLVTKLEKIRN